LLLSIDLFNLADKSATLPAMKSALALLALLPFNFLFSLWAPQQLQKHSAAQEFEQIRPLPAPGEQLRGLYMTSHTASTPRGLELADEFAEVGGNMIVFDIQDASGRLAYPSRIPTSIDLDNYNDQIEDLPALVRELHRRGFYVVARYVLFNNRYLANRTPNWGLKIKGTNTPLTTNEGVIWLDPGNPQLLDYLADVGREIALSGVDEIQFDYVRFPSGFRNQGYTGDDHLERHEVITNSVAHLGRELHLLGTKVSLDIFGIAVWDNVSWKVVGQNIGELGKHVDAIYPMPYPSHFGPGWGGHKNPADEPYFFVQETSKKFVEGVAGTNTEIRPWFQAFTMRVTNYGPWYIQEQQKAADDIALPGWVLWNARNDYAVPFAALRGKQNLTES